MKAQHVYLQDTQRYSSLFPPRFGSLFICMSPPTTACLIQTNNQSPPPSPSSFGLIFCTPSGVRRLHQPKSPGSPLRPAASWTEHNDDDVYQFCTTIASALVSVFAVDLASIFIPRGLFIIVDLVSSTLVRFINTGSRAVVVVVHRRRLIIYGPSSARYGGRGGVSSAPYYFQLSQFIRTRVGRRALGPRALPYKAPLVCHICIPGFMPLRWTRAAGSPHIIKLFIIILSVVSRWSGNTLRHPGMVLMS